MPFNLHAIDLLLLLILAATAMSGWRRGFAVVTLGYAGLLVGLALGAWAAARVGLFISAEDSLRRLLVGIVVFFLVAVVCHSLATRFGMQLRSTITGRVGGNVDAVGGAVVAVDGAQHAGVRQRPGERALLAARQGADGLQRAAHHR